MAADNEVRLLSRVVRDRDLSAIMSRNMDDSWFHDPDSKAVFGFITRHFARYGEVPTSVTVIDNFPTYRLLNVNDTADYLADQLTAYNRRMKTIRLLQDATDQVTVAGDHEAALEMLMQGVARIGDTGSQTTAHEIDITTAPLDRWKQYEDIKNRGGGLLGLPTGFSTIDQATAGLQPGQLIVIIAPPKTGKSVLALQIASHIHDHGSSPYFTTFEMSNEEQQSRKDAFGAKIGHARLQRGELRPDEETRYRRYLKYLATLHPFWMADSVTGTTVSAIGYRASILRPSALFIDGVYLMTDEISGEQNTPRALTNITRNLKRLAQKLQIPIIISTQVLTWKMRGNKVTADSIGYSSSFFQDADVILGLQKDEDETPDCRILRIVASRNCGPVEVDMLWDWENGKFEEFQAAA